MPGDLCKHDIERSSCAVCNTPPKPKSGFRRDGTPRGATLAEFEGTCADCSEVITIGDPIVYSERFQGWVHVEGCG